jgi:hypothetical protein
LIAPTPSGGGDPRARAVDSRVARARDHIARDSDVFITHRFRSCRKQLLVGETIPKSGGCESAVFSAMLKPSQCPPSDGRFRAMAPRTHSKSELSASSALERPAGAGLNKTGAIGARPIDASLLRDFEMVSKFIAIGCAESRAFQDVRASEWIGVAGLIAVRIAGLGISALYSKLCGAAQRLTGSPKCPASHPSRAKRLRLARGDSGMKNKPAQGDLIEVYHARAERSFPRSTWIAARVVEISANGSIVAQALEGAFDDSHDHIILEFRHRGNTWR